MIRVAYMIVGALLVRIADRLWASPFEPSPLWWLVVLLVAGVTLIAFNELVTEKR